MNNDMTYIVLMVLGAISFLFFIFSSHAMKRTGAFIVASILFIQAGVCVYRGVNGLHRKRKNDLTLIDSESHYTKTPKSEKRKKYE